MKVKKITKTKILPMLVCVSMILFCSNSLQAQHTPHKHQPVENSVIEMVSDLSAIQKRKLESLQKESKNKIESLKQQRKAVKDSIQTLMDEYGDHTREVYPLIERDAALHAEISREYYRVKVRIDEIITREQSNEFKAKMKQKCSKEKPPKMNPKMPLEKKPGRKMKVKEVK